MNVSPVLPTSGLKQGYTGLRLIKEHIDVYFDTVNAGNQGLCSCRMFAPFIIAKFA